MREVGGGRGEHDLGVRGQLDLPHPGAVVGERHPAQLGVVLGADHHLEPAADRAVTPDDLGAVLGEGDLVAVRLDAARLISGRPDLAALRVAEEDEGPPGVASGVLAEAGDGDVLEAAVAGAGRGQHHRVAAVAQQVAPGDGVVRGVIAADCRRGEADLRGGRDLFGARPGHRHVARRPLLQQQLGRLDERGGVEAGRHGAVLPDVQDVRQGEERHPLVMRHVGVHHGEILPLGQTGGRVVDRLVEAIPAAAAGALQPREIADRRPRLKHRRERRRIGRHHHVLGEPPLEPEAGHPEV